MSSFDPPTGDLAAIRAAGALFASVGTDLHTDLGTTRASVVEGVRDWSGERFQAFITAGAGVQYQLRTASAGCAGASAALAGYATAFQTATTDVAHYASLAGAAQTAATGGPGGKPDPDLLESLPTTVAGYATDADTAKRTLAKAAATAAAAIDLLTAKVAPASSRLTPAQIRRQVNGEFHLSGLQGSPTGTLTTDQALTLLGAAQQTVPITAINADGTVDYVAADAVPDLPLPGTSPKDVNTWWNSLSPMEQDALLTSRYAQVGNLDGVPVIDRDVANRTNLPVLTTNLQGQITTLQGQEPTHYTMGGTPRFPMQVTNPDWATWHDKITGLQTRLSSLQQVATTIASTSPAPHYLIGLQDVGNGRAIISTGNPDTAANVATYVPGMGTKLSGIQGGVNRANAMYTSAQTAGSTSTSTIAWYGYDAPQGLSDAASEDDAKKAAPLLDGFVSGLRATHDGTFHSVVVSHSYGTTVTGMAASHGNTLDVDDVVFVASPGSTVDHASDLHLAGGKPGTDQDVYATTAEYDPIRLAEGINGGAPVNSGYGSHDFTSNPDRGHWYELGWNASAHSAYWDNGTPSLRSMGLIIAGQGQQTQ